MEFFVKILYFQQKIQLQTLSHHQHMCAIDLKYLHAQKDNK